MKLWGGRFEKETDKLVEAYTASIPFDIRLYHHDVAGSIAHARMLARQGIISQEDATAIVEGLRQVEQEIASGAYRPGDELEDVHLAVESRLREIIGEPAGRLHTGRSRNDQVATDLRLWLRDAIDDTLGAITDLRTALVDLAERHRDVLMPGYTHLQRAQPVLVAHHLLAYFEQLGRDAERLIDCRRRANVLPLGSGALAGTVYPLNRESVAAELGFDAISRNSMDAVSDRDFVVEYLAAAALCMAHLSRFAEDLVLWASAEFGFVELDDAYATGSSIMPQKKNPDVAELARGKTGRVYGHLMAMLTTLKGLPMTYNRDLQEDKEALFGAHDTLHATIEVFAGMFRTMQFRTARMQAVAGADYLLATDVADYLTARGIPFREAHEIVGRLVRRGIERGKALADLTLEDYRAASPHFAEDVLQITAHSSAAARNIPGGTAPGRVVDALAEARKRIEHAPRKPDRAPV